MAYTLEFMELEFSPTEWQWYKEDKKSTGKLKVLSEWLRFRVDGVERKSIGSVEKANFPPLSEHAQAIQRAYHQATVRYGTQWQPGTITLYKNDAFNMSINVNPAGKLVSAWFRFRKTN